MEGLEYSSLVLHCSAIKNTVVYLHTFYSNGVKILSHSLSLTDSYKVVMAVLEKYEWEGSCYLTFNVVSNYLKPLFSTVETGRDFLATKYITAFLSFFHFAPFCSYVWTIIINCCFLYEEACKYTPTWYQFNTTIQLYTGVLPPVPRTLFSWLQWLRS